MTRGIVTSGMFPASIVLAGTAVFVVLSGAKGMAFSSSTDELYAEGWLMYAALLLLVVGYIHDIEQH